MPPTIFRIKPALRLAVILVQQKPTWEPGTGYAYVMNRMSAKMGGDPRDLALGEAFRRAIDQAIAVF